MNNRVLLYIILFLLVPCSSFAEEIQGMVRHVYDGDTVLLVGRKQGELKLRLYGIDAPESVQPFGKVARRVLMYKLLGREITAEIRDRDRYGRSVAVLRLGRRDINAEMVREGMAWAYRQYLNGPYASEYIRFEELARRQRRGLWKQDNPQPPWEFRNGKGTVKGNGRRRH